MKIAERLIAEIRYQYHLGVSTWGYCWTDMTIKEEYAELQWLWLIHIRYRRFLSKRLRDPAT